jgi:hypothetical protein
MEQHIFLARTMMGIVVAVFLTLVGDVVAMLRHPSQWMGQPATNELLLMLVGQALLALLIPRHIVRSSNLFGRQLHRAKAEGQQYILVHGTSKRLEPGRGSHDGYSFIVSMR